MVPAFDDSGIERCLMPKGDPKEGLLKAIIDVINDFDPEQCYHPDEITKELKKRSYWKPGDARTPERTVHMYFTENPHIFSATAASEYFLNEAYWFKRSGDR